MLTYALVFCVMSNGAPYCQMGIPNLTQAQCAELLPKFADTGKARCMSKYVETWR